MAFAVALDRATEVMRDTFPQAIVYDPTGGAHVLAGIFDNNHKLVEVTPEGAAVTTTVPALQVRLADLAAVGVTPHVRDIVDIGAERFEVYDIRRDNSGLVTLPLVRVN